MPSPKKVNLLPPEFRKWLEESLLANGFSDYYALADALNKKLADAGMELTIQKSSLGKFGIEYREFVKIQREASEWAKAWISEADVGDDVQRHNVLFQMSTSLSFRSMCSEMVKPPDEIDYKKLQAIGRIMRDLMASAETRQQLVADERRMLAEKFTEAMAAGNIDVRAAEKARQIMGFE